MAEISIERSGLAQTAVASLLTIAALALLGLVLAYWTWVWFAPGSTPRAQLVDTIPRIKSADGLFGGASRKPGVIAPTGLAIKLHGIVAAAGGRRGYAVMQLDAKEILAVREGADVAPGVRLVEVHADHVVLERNGARETLAWPEKVGANRDRPAQSANSNPVRETAALPPTNPPEERRARRERD